MSKSTPATPDYVGAAQATAQSSADTTEAQTYANRPDVSTPWSQQTWQATPTWDPTSGTYVNQWSQNTSLVPQAQSALNSQLDVANNLSITADTLTGQANTELTQPLDWSNFQALGATPQAQSYTDPTLQNSIDTSGNQNVGSADSYANTAGNAAYTQYMNRNQPLQQTALTNMQTQLQNQGLQPGDVAYDTAIKNLQNQQSDANTQASLGATQFGIQGGQIMQGEDLATNQNQFNQEGTQATFANSAAQSTLQDQMSSGAQTFGQQDTSANYSDQVRQQQISEDLQQRGFTTNEISALLTGNQVQTGPSPQFNAAASAQPVNYARCRHSSSIVVGALCHS
jgi:hypothetical protein